ncbi:hypothetical protein SARC_04546, partial [Sphaeroforma arctica JP610]
KCAATIVTLSMVKANKKKGRPTSLTSTENTTLVTDNSGKWTSGKCKDILRSVNAPLKGDIEVIRQRCVLLKDLQALGVGSVLVLKVDAARRLCNQLELAQGTKVEMVERIGRTLMNQVVRQQNDALIAAIRDE